MSVHSTHYDNQEEYERDLKYEYRKEQYEQDHGIIEDLPFYTDDPDDPHWRCENCGHCKSIKILKRIIKYVSWVDENGYVHNNPNHPETLKAVVWPDSAYQVVCFCNLRNCEVFDDDYCEEFIEEGEDQ